MSPKQADLAALHSGVKGCFRNNDMLYLWQMAQDILCKNIQALRKLDEWHKLSSHKQTRFLREVLLLGRYHSRDVQN